jgi:hypothetical protein
MENCNKDKDASLLERLKVLQTKRSYFIELDF